MSTARDTPQRDGEDALPPNESSNDTVVADTNNLEIDVRISYIPNIRTENGLLAAIVPYC
jgi:hypothetical protein